MLNFYVEHLLPGAPYSQALCTCGYEELLQNNEKWSKCPQCESIRIKFFNDLSFDKQIIDSNFLLITELEGVYNFYIDIGHFHGAIKAKFSKKKVEFCNSTLKQQHWRIYFNGTLPKDEMIKIIDINTNKEVEIKHISTNLNIAKNRMLVTNKTYVSNSKKFVLPTMYNSTDLTLKLQILSNNLQDLKKYCLKYEQIIKAGIDVYELNGKLDMSKTNTQAQMMLQPYMFKFLKEHGASQHSSLQLVQDLFGPQAINYMQTFALLENGLSTYSIRKMAELVNNGNLSIKKLYKYLYIDAPLQQGLYRPSRTLELLHDSFDLATKLELPFDKNPKALQRYHDILTKEFNMIKDNRKNEIFAKTVKNYKHLELIEQDCEENESDSIKKQKFAMILPVDAQDLIREGKLMRHCVASYVDRVIKETSIIFFLRKVENLDTPYATIEVDSDMHIRQVKMKANSKLNDKAANDFIKKWCRIHNIKWNGQW